MHSGALVSAKLFIHKKCIFRIHLSLAPDSRLRQAKYCVDWIVKHKI